MDARLQPEYAEQQTIMGPSTMFGFVDRVSPDKRTAVLRRATGGEVLVEGSYRTIEALPLGKYVCLGGFATWDMHEGDEWLLRSFEATGGPANIYTMTEEVDWDGPAGSFFRLREVLSETAQMNRLLENE